MTELANKIPDIHFDWYARIIPGTVALIYYFYISNIIPEITTSLLLTYGFFSYILGHIVQPMSSFGIKNIYKRVECNESLFSTSKKNSDLSKLIDLVEKSHAEATGMFSSFILVSLIFIYIKIIQNENFSLQTQEFISFAIILYFLFASIERAKARKRKINDLK